jgi:eukaryotic-like serine/threonine-protein kinase
MARDTDTTRIRTRARAPRYELEHELGRGGMAIVYAAVDMEMGRRVALKVLAAHLAGDPAFRKRFLREARIAASLSHPNLVRVYDIGEHDGQPCIVMELAEGGTLEGGRLTSAEAAQVAEGLAYAHAHGVVHRDLKPGNLLRTTDGVVKIADFGIARAAEETRVTQIGTVLGTLRYLSPEQAEGRDVGPEADVYSLGVVLDELLGEKPRSVRRLLERCRARDPRRRPTAGDLAAVLRAQTASATAVTIVQRTRPRRTVPVLAVVAVAAALAVLVAVLALDRSSAPAPPPRVTPVPRSTDASRQARNLIAWIDRYSAP